MKRKNDADDAVELAEGGSKPQTFIDRMIVERGELANRMQALVGFMELPPFYALDQEEQDRMRGQRTAMGHYLEILDARIAYHQARGVTA